LLRRNGVASRKAKPKRSAPDGPKFWPYR
jgi:hypothetical protein